MHAKTILLIEEGDGARDVLRRLLEGAGFAVVQADRAYSALQIMERGELHLLLVDTDIRGGLNALELAHIARAKHPGIPVILMTTRTDELWARELAPPTFVMRKPFDLRNLLTAVQRLMAGV